MLTVVPVPPAPVETEAPEYGFYCYNPWAYCEFLAYSRELPFSTARVEAWILQNMHDCANLQFDETHNCTG
jgi:hypothetical protein